MSCSGAHEERYLPKLPSLSLQSILFAEAERHVSLHLSGPVDILRLQTRDFEMGRNAPKNTFNKSRYRGAAIREKTLAPARVRQTDRHTHHWPVTSVDIKTACKKFEIMSSNRNDINPIVKLGTTTTKTVSYSLCEIIDVLLLHHLNTTMEQLTEPSLKRTPEDLSFEKNKKPTRRANL